MDTTAKQRVLGIIVLIALLGIVLTVLLHNSREENARATSIASSTPASTPTTANTTAITETSTSDQNLNNINTALNSEVQAQQNAQAANNSLTLEQQASENSTNSTNSASSEIASASIANSNSAIDLSHSTEITPPAKSAPLATKTPIEKTIKKPTANTVNNTNHSNSDSISIPTIKSTLPPVTVKPLSSEAHTSPAKPTAPTTASVTPAPSTFHAAHESLPATSTTSAATPASANSSASTSKDDVTVQVGTFDVPDNAIDLVKKLKAHGFIARTEKVSTDKGEMTRVTVGPMAQTESAANALNEKLKSEMNISGIIVPKETQK